MNRRYSTCAIISRVTWFLPEQFHSDRYEKQDRKQDLCGLFQSLQVLDIEFLVSLRGKDDGNCKDHKDVWSV